MFIMYFRSLVEESEGEGVGVGVQGRWLYLFR